MKKTTLIFEDLPKISLNEWYSGRHWSERSKMKKQFEWLVYVVTRQKFYNPCTVDYDFEFKKNALDCTNTIGIIKQLEDCLFPDDSWKIVKKISITSKKGENDVLTVTINEL